MSVFIPIPIADVEQEREPPSLTYRLDFDKGRILSIGSADGIEAINQFIKKALLTPRFKCLIYDNQYGSEIKQTIITDDATTEYIETDMPRIVKDALLCDTRILDVYDFSFSFDREEAFVKFKAKTIFGEITVEEVI